DPAEALDGRLDAALDDRAVRDVPRNGERLGAGPLDLGDAVVERLGVPGRDDDLGAALAGEPRNRAPEPARGAGDDDHLLVHGPLGHPRLLPAREDATLRP